MFNTAKESPASTKLKGIYPREPSSSIHILRLLYSITATDLNFSIASNDYLLPVGFCEDSMWYLYPVADCN